MHVGSILVGFVLLAALGAVVIRPWWRPATQRVMRTSSSDPREEYETLVAAIRDLDFDYRAGVVTEADYRPLRNDLAARAVALMQELDRQPDQTTDASIEDQIEAAVSALRAQHHAEPRNRKDKETRRQGEGERARSHLGAPSPPLPLSRAPQHPCSAPLSRMRAPGARRQSLLRSMWCSTGENVPGLWRPRGAR